jgi:hypothetical protein
MVIGLFMSPGMFYDLNIHLPLDRTQQQSHYINVLGRNMSLIEYISPIGLCLIAL